MAREMDLRIVRIEDAVHKLPPGTTVDAYLDTGTIEIDVHSLHDKERS